MIPPICILVDADVPIVQLCEAVVEAGLQIGNVDGYTLRIRRQTAAETPPTPSNVIDLATRRPRPGA